jgi:hypothetical protein
MSVVVPYPAPPRESGIQEIVTDSRQRLDSRFQRGTRATHELLKALGPRLREDERKGSQWVTTMKSVYSPVSPPRP